MSKRNKNEIENARKDYSSNVGYCRENRRN